MYELDLIEEKQLVFKNIVFLKSILKEMVKISYTIVIYFV